MADNVVTFPGVELRKEGRNEEVIEMLERLIAEAESGNIESVALVAVRKDQSVISGFHRYAGAHVFTLIGAASSIHAKLLSEAEGRG